MGKVRIRVSGQDEGNRLESFLVVRLGRPAAEVRQLLAKGAVTVNGRRVNAGAWQVRFGEQVIVFVEDEERGATRAALLGPERVLYEDAEVIAVDKPAGVQAQPTPTSDYPDLVDLVSRRIGAPVGLVHRLDLETTGVTVFGKTHAATAALAASFARGEAQKSYLAVAVGALPDEGVIDLPISPDRRRWGKFRAREGGELSALTRYRVLARSGSLCAVEARPETGRTHQIRVHLKALGAPLAGDALYGGPTQVETLAGPRRVERTMLHARSLELQHPSSRQPLRFEAPVPEDLRALLRAARLAAEAP